MRPWVGTLLVLALGACAQEDSESVVPLYDTAPVEIDAHAPPAHSDACGMWGWIELTYADGFTFVHESGEWGESTAAVFNSEAVREGGRAGPI